MRVRAERRAAEPQPGAPTLRLLLLSALLAAALASAAVAQKRPVVREIRIDIGPHRQISEDVVRSQLTAVSVGMEYDQAKTDAALRAVLDTGYFQRDPKLSYVEAAPQGDDVALVFRLRENSIIESVVVEGNTVLDDATIVALLKDALQPGRVLNSRMVDEWIQEAVAQAYGDRGYAAIVLRPTLSEQGVLTIAIVEQYIEDVRLAGLRKTKEKVVRREIEARPGQLVNTRRIQEDLDRLLALGIFEDVSVGEWVPGQQAGAVIPVYTFTERETGSFTAGGSFDTRRGLLGYLEYAEANLGGHARRFKIAGEFGTYLNLDATYVEPHIGRRTSLEAHAFANQFQTGRLSIGGLVSNFSAESRTGAEVAVTRALDNDRHRIVSLGYRNEYRQNYDPRLTNVLSADALRGRVGAVRIRLGNDTRDLVDNPRRGSLQIGTLEYSATWLGSHSTFARAEVDARQYLSLGSRGVFALRANAGTTLGTLPPIFESFRLGGADSLRGYAEDRWWGTNRVLLSAEYRHQIIGHNPNRGVQLVLFADYGSAWGGAWGGSDGSSLAAEDQRFAGHFGYGVGLRVNTRLFPLHIDYGIGSGGGRFHAGIQHTF